MAAGSANNESFTPVEAMAEGTNTTSPLVAMMMGGNTTSSFPIPWVVEMGGATTTTSPLVVMMTGGAILHHLFQSLG